MQQQKNFEQLYFITKW